MSVSSSSTSPLISRTMMQRVIVYGNRGSSSRTSTAADVMTPPANSSATGRTIIGNNENEMFLKKSSSINDNDASAVDVSLDYKKIPTATKGNVLIKVICAGLNPVDAKHVMGDKMPHSWTYLQKLYRNKVLAGKIIGFDFSGIVQHCPCGSFQQGDHVFGTMPPFQGTLAEYIVAPLHQVYYKSKQHSFEEAAALPLVGLTALQSLSPHIKSSNISAVSSSASSVLIIGGSGGTGHVASQVARNLGARHVTTLCSSRNADFCKERGATHVVDYHKPRHELVQSLQSAPGYPFDVVLDCVTSGDPRDSAQHHYPSLVQDPHHGLMVPPLQRKRYVYLRLGGVFWDWFRAGLRRMTYGTLNLFWGPEQLFWVRFPHSAHELRQLVQWADTGLLTPYLHTLADTTQDNNKEEEEEEETEKDEQQQQHRVYDFTPQAVQQAFRAILSRRVKGKLVIRVSDDTTTPPT